MAPEGGQAKAIIPSRGGVSLPPEVSGPAARAHEPRTLAEASSSPDAYAVGRPALPKGSGLGFAAPGVLRPPAAAGVSKGIQGTVDWLAKLGTSRPEVGQFAHDLRKEFLALKDSEPTEAMNRSAAALRRYALAADQRDRTVRTFSDFYPENTSAPYHLDYSEGGEAAKGFVSEEEVSLEDMGKLPVVTAYARLKASGDPEDRAAVQAVGDALADLRKNGTLTAGERTDFNYRFFTSHLKDAAAVEKRAEEMERLFGSSPSLLRFLKALQENPEAPEGTDVDGPATARQLEKSYSGLKTLTQIEDAFPKHEEQGLARITSESLSQVRGVLAGRAEAYRKFLEAEAGRLEKAGSHAGPTPGNVCMDGKPRPEELRARAREVAAYLEKLGAVDLSDHPKGFRELKKLSAAAVSYEREHIGKLLGRQIDQLEALPTKDPRDGADIEAHRRNLATLGQMGKGDEAYVAAGRLIQADIGRTASIRTASARIAQYEAYLDEEYKANQLPRGVLKIAGLFVDDLRPDDSTIPERKLTDTIARYKALREDLRSADPETRARAQRELINKQRSGLTKTLDEQFESTQVANLAIGVSIVIASALTAGLVAEAAAPFLIGRAFVAGVDAGAVAVRGLHAAAFVASSRVYELPFSRRTVAEKGREIADKPLEFVGDFASEVVMTGLMFKYLETMMGGFHAFFGKGLEKIARQRVLTRLGLGGGKAGSSTALVRAGQGSAIDLAVKAEHEALQKAVSVRIAEAVSGFTNEAGAFQMWTFAVAAARYGAKGDPDFLEKARREAFSRPAVLHGAQFLLGLKALNMGAMPLSRPLFEAIGRTAQGRAMRKEIDKLSKDESALQTRFERLWTGGKEDAAKLDADIRDYLVVRRNFLEAVPVESLPAAAQKSVQRARAETGDLIRAYEGFGPMARHLEKVHADASHGIRWGDGGGDVHTYAGDGNALARALEHPGLKVKSSGRLFGQPILVVEATLPMGLARTFTFLPSTSPHGKQEVPPMLH